MIKLEHIVLASPEQNDDIVHAIWNPDKAIEGVFCPRCNTWIDDYYGQPDKCPTCGVRLDGWIDIRDFNKEKEAKKND